MLKRIISELVSGLNRSEVYKYKNKNQIHQFLTNFVDGYYKNYFMEKDLLMLKKVFLDIVKNGFISMSEDNNLNESLSWCIKKLI